MLLLYFELLDLFHECCVFALVVVLFDDCLGIPLVDCVSIQFVQSFNTHDLGLKTLNFIVSVRCLPSVVFDFSLQSNNFIV